MFTSRWTFYFILIILFINCFTFGQQEIRQAIKAKKNRKFNETKTKIEHGKQHVHDATNQIRAPINRVNNNVQNKYKNTRRKIQAIENIIKS